MSGLWFTEDHEWIRIDDDEGAVVGITDYAQDQLGELVFVELPGVGAELDQGEEGAVIESVKAAGELKIPASGTVTEVNDTLVDEPGQVNADPLGDGWFLSDSDKGRLRTRRADGRGGLSGLRRIAGLNGHAARSAPAPGPGVRSRCIRRRRVTACAGAGEPARFGTVRTASAARQRTVIAATRQCDAHRRT